MTENAPFRVLPEYRLYSNFPWQIWMVGWIALYKSISWLIISPDIENALLGYKYIILAIPYMVLGSGILNLRSWAVWGILFVSVLNILFYLVFPDSISLFFMKEFYGESSFADFFWTGIFCAALIDGPLGDLAILLMFPILKKHKGQSGQFNY